MLSCGVDSVLISRIANSMQKEGFMQRVYSKEECAYIKAKHNAAETAAGHFAAKEALLKALGTGITSLDLHEIGITHTEQGAPIFVLTNKVAQVCDGKEISLSITHAGDYATAFVVIEE